MDVSCFKMAAIRRISQGKQCAYFGCSNRVYDAKGNQTRYRFFSFLQEKNLGRVWENRMSRMAGKDRFVITKAVRVYNVHFQESDILRVPGGSHLCWKKGALPLKWNQRPTGKQEKRKAPTKRKSQLSNILSKSSESLHLEKSGSVVHTCKHVNTFILTLFIKTGQ